MLSLFEDKPNYILPDASVSKTTKSNWLLSLCETFIDKYVFDSGDINCLVQQTHELELATLGHYNCRAEGCERVFLYHSGRVTRGMRRSFIPILFPLMKIQHKKCSPAVLLTTCTTTTMES